MQEKEKGEEGVYKATIGKRLEDMVHMATIGKKEEKGALSLSLLLNGSR